MIFEDRDGTTPLGNPFTPSSLDNGLFRFHAIGGAYRVRLFNGSGFEVIWRYVGVGTAGESDEAIQFPGYLLTWDTGTADEDPGEGGIRANNADLSAATVLYISKTSAGGSDIAERLLELGAVGKTVKDRIILTRSDQVQASFAGDAVAEGDNSPPSYVKVTVSDHAGETSFGDGEPISFLPVLSGADGAAGEVQGPDSSVAGQIAVFADTSGEVIEGADLGDSPPTPVSVGTVADVRASTAGKVVHAGHLNDAAAVATLTDDTTIAIDWSAGINFEVTLTTNRTLGNPTNEIPGQWRTVLVKSDGGPDTLAFGAEYGGDVPTIDDVTTTQFYFLMTVPTTAVPTGFNIIINLNDGSDVRAILSYKIADGSEAAASLSGMNSSAEWKALYVFRGNIPITSATPTDPESETTDGNPTAKTVNASGGTPPLVVVAGYFGGGAAVSPRTFTVGGSAAKDGEINPTTALYLAYKIYNSSPADVVIDLDDEGVDNTIAGCYIVCA